MPDSSSNDRIGDLTMIDSKPRRLLVSRTEARELLGCSLALLRGLERRGDLTPIRLGEGGKGLRYRVAEIDALIGKDGAGDNAPIHAVSQI
jgi:hypothetical protein